MQIHIFEFYLMFFGVSLEFLRLRLCHDLI